MDTEQQDKVYSALGEMNLLYFTLQETFLLQEENQNALRRFKKTAAGLLVSLPQDWKYMFPPHEFVKYTSL